MEMVQSELEIFLIPEPICLPFEGFDFIVDAFDHSASDRVLEVVEQAGSIGSQGLAHFGQGFDSGPECVSAPGFQERSCSCSIFLFPEESELLLHRMGGEERLVGLKQGIEPGFPVRFEIFIVSEQQETVPFKGLLPKLIKFPLLFSAQVFNGLIDKSHDVVAVKDDVDMRQDLPYSIVVGTAHVHGHSLKFLALSSKLFQKRDDILLSFPFDRMENPATAQISNDGHILMALPYTELVDANVADLVKRDGPIEDAQFGFMDILDQIPTNSKIVCYPPNSPKAEKIESGEGKGADISMFSDHERQAWPPKSATIDTSQAMKIKDEYTFLAPNGAHEEPPSLLAFHGGVTATTFGTMNQSIGHFASKNHCIRPVMGGHVADTLQPKSVVHYRSGHGLEPPYVV
jgi:hypothetical protein